jgi:hypothetical protein
MHDIVGNIHMHVCVCVCVCVRVAVQRVPLIPDVATGESSFN